MKYLIILFACSVAFMTLVVLDSIEAQVKQFTSFDDFFVHLQKTTNSWIDFVRQIQGLMCPDQPVCGDNKILEKEDVLSTLPAALIVANVSVNLEDVRSYAGVCCQPCFCSDTCWQHDNCCPTKQVLANENMTTEVQAECFVATVRSYNNKAFPATEYINYIYRMTTDCFIDNSNHTLLASCRTPDTTQIDGIIPVTSKTTETTYWNRACAACNHDDNDIIDWIPTVIYKREDPYFGDPSHVGTDFPTTFDYLLAAFSQSRSSIRGDLIYKPPISMEASVCTRKDSIHMDYCETSPDRNNLALQGWMSKACNRFYNPVHGTFQPFMNIFCFICQYKIQPKDKDIACRKSFMKDSEGFFQALLNYKQGEDKSEGDGEGGPIAEDKRCRCTEIYDPYLVSYKYVDYIGRQID